MKRIKTYNGLKYCLNKEIKRGRLLDVKRTGRRIGKTSLLFKLAEENNFYIIVPFVKLAKAFNKEFNTGRFIAASESLNGRSFEGLLLDEGINLTIEKELRKRFNVVGGYSSNFKKKGN